MNVQQRPAHYLSWPLHTPGNKPSRDQPIINRLRTWSISRRIRWSHTRLEITANDFFFFSHFWSSLLKYLIITLLMSGKLCKTFVVRIRCNSVYILSNLNLDTDILSILSKVTENCSTHAYDC